MGDVLTMSSTCPCAGSFDCSVRDRYLDLLRRLGRRGSHTHPGGSDAVANVVKECQWDAGIGISHQVVDTGVVRRVKDVHNESADPVTGFCSSSHAGGNFGLYARSVASVAVCQRPDDARRFGG
jgi:hypothetical protein